MLRVARLWRYPVKSMLGEEVAEAHVGLKGLVGDRAYALLDPSDGTIASAKNAKRWGRLLEFQASFAEEPPSEADVPAVTIRFPDGSEHRSDEAGIDERLSAALERDVRLIREQDVAKELEIVWAREGLTPQEKVETTAIGTQDGEVLGRTKFGVLSPPDRYFDYSVLHVLTTTTLAHLQRLAPAATFDPRRYRPNLLLDTDGEGFVENDWVGRTLAGDALQVRVLMECMRCVMTTLPQQDLPRDRLTLRAVAAHNRRDVQGMGRWACAGVYADVAVPGRIAVGSTMTTR
jgi:uncharacterized protein YcbX